MEYAKEAKCPTCEQTLHDEKHQQLLLKLEKDISELHEDETKLNSDLSIINKNISDIGDIGILPDTYYDTIDDAYNHKGSLADLKRQFEQTEKKENPYQEQIEELTESALQTVD